MFGRAGRAGASAPSGRASTGVIASWEITIARTAIAVVRKRDAKWGEVPIAFVARRDESLSASELNLRCRAELAGYKQPKAIRWIAFDAFPRSASGKVQRHELEKRLPDFEEER